MLPTDTGPYSAVFTVVRNGGTFGAVTIRWVLVSDASSEGDVTDLVGVNVTPDSGTVTFDDGIKERVIVLTVIQVSGYFCIVFVLFCMLHLVLS